MSSALSPRFSPDGAVLVFLSAHAAVDSGVHASTNSLHMAPWPPEGVLPSPGGAHMDLEREVGEDGEATPLLTPTMDLAIQTVVRGPQTSNLKPQTLNLKPQTRRWTGVTRVRFRVPVFCAQIDVVPRAEEVGGFPGLYCSKLAPQPWLADNRTVLLTTYWRSTTAIIAAHVERYEGGQESVGLVAGGRG